MLTQKLETFLTVAETKSITKAASILHLTQPAVSQQIKALGEKFSCKLFVRSDNTLKITEEGEIVLLHAKRMQAIYNQCILALKDSSTHHRHISMGITRSAEMSGISEMLAQYCNNHPGTHIKIYTGSISNLYNLLRSYEADLIIVEGKIPDPSLNTILLDTDYLVLTMGNNNPLSKKKVVALSDIKKEKLILRLNTSGTRALFEETLKANGESIDNFNVVLEVNSITTIKDLIKNNYGVSIMGHSLCRTDIKNKEYKACTVENISMTREINMVYHPDFPHKDLLNDIYSLYNEMIKEEK